MIEILPDVYYNPSLPWYEQDPQLIALAESVMLEAPKSSDAETAGENSRLLWAIWEHTTTIDTFDMRVDFHWLYAIESRAFMSKELQDTVIITPTA
jgi:hypothetical protein